MAKILYMILCLMLMDFAGAYVLEGIVYDWELQPANDTIIELWHDGSLVSRFISKNSSYSIELEKGDYSLLASRYAYGEMTMHVEENITIQTDKYLDLILFPDFDFPLDDSILNLTIEEYHLPRKDSGFLFAAVVLLVIVIILAMIFRPKKKEMIKRDYDAHILEILDLIRNLGNKATQKELRKRLAHSEAKVSLMLSILEKDGRIRKIRKGRSNIIVLVE